MFNTVILVGNLTRDPELKYTQGGLAICKTGIATNRKFKKQNGEQVDETMFIDITFFGRSGEIVNQYLRKGSKVLIEGRLMLEQWTDQNGQKRSKHSISVEDMKMLDSRTDAAQGSYNAPTGNNDTYAPPRQAHSNGYQQPQQGYNPPSQPQNAYQPPRQSMPENTIPEIDIEEDEIPF
ncbi:single-stranded DNA-binding protein [Thiomicrolovo sp. ZZH C-3]